MPPGPPGDRRQRRYLALALLVLLLNLSLLAVLYSLPEADLHELPGRSPVAVKGSAPDIQ